MASIVGDLSKVDLLLVIGQVCPARKFDAKNLAVFSAVLFIRVDNAALLGSHLLLVTPTCLAHVRLQRLGSFAVFALVAVLDVTEVDVFVVGSKLLLILGQQALHWAVTLQSIFSIIDTLERGVFITFSSVIICSNGGFKFSAQLFAALVGSFSFSVYFITSLVVEALVFVADFVVGRSLAQRFVVCRYALSFQFLVSLLFTGHRIGKFSLIQEIFLNALACRQRSSDALFGQKLI